MTDNNKTLSLKSSNPSHKRGTGSGKDVRGHQPKTNNDAPTTKLPSHKTGGKK